MKKLIVVLFILVGCASNPHLFKFDPEYKYYRENDIWYSDGSRTRMVEYFKYVYKYPPKECYSTYMEKYDAYYVSCEDLTDGKTDRVSNLYYKYKK